MNKNNWLFLILIVLMPPSAFGAEAVIANCGAAGRAVIDGLDETQRAKVVWPFAGPERRAWTFVTGSKSRKQGLALADLSDGQKVLAHRLIRCGLSSQGYQKAAGIMRLDDFVREHIGEIVFKATGPIEIGKEYYWLAIFGSPDEGSPWGWQLEGHHLALNFTVIDGAIAVTPSFMGADPAEVQRGPLSGWRLLGGEEDRAYALINSLTDEQRNLAVIADTVPRGLFTSPGRAQTLEKFEGLPAGSMSPNQRQLMWLLLNEYVQNVDPAIADRMIGQVLSDGMDALYFAWMGSTAPGSVMYYRIQGPSLLIEFDHASNIRSPGLEPDPNHIHTIVRVPGRDFGDDLLQRHYRESPAHIAPPIEK
jgi:hypothetical protein